MKLIALTKANNKQVFFLLGFRYLHIKHLPKNKKLSWLRANSATYQAEVFNYCEENNINFGLN